MKNIPIDLPKLRISSPLAIRSCVLGGYSDFQALVIADRASRDFSDAYPHERAIAEAQVAQAHAQQGLNGAVA